MNKSTYLGLLVVMAIALASCTADPFLDLQDQSNSTEIDAQVETESETDTSIESDDGPCFTTSLMAGQHYESGIVSVAIEDGNLIITYSMNPEWTIGISHLQVGNCDEDWVPLNGGGNPQIGQFEYTQPISASDTEVVYSISLDALGDTICFAAHAEVEGPTGGETAWAEGAQFEGNGWAMFVQTDLTECEETTDPGGGGAF